MHYQFAYRSHAKALYEALQVDAFYTTMEQSVDNGSPTEAMISYLDYSIREAGQFGTVTLPERHDHGVSVWSKPLSDELQKQKDHYKEQFLEQHMGRSSLDTYRAIVDFMAQATGEVVTGDAWYLSIIGILPAHQGKGLGAELLEPVLEKTDCLQVSTYLETFTPRNVSFYERFGYRSIKEIQEPTTGAVYQVMLRESAPDT